MPVTRIQLGSVSSRLITPPTPPFPTHDAPVAVKKMSDGEIMSAIQDLSLTEGQFFPLEMKLGNGAWWKFPQEPFIDLSCKSAIIRRNVAKTSDLNGVRGTVKERWNSGDCTINISGVFRVVNHDGTVEYPRAAVEKLRSFCEARKAIEVKCPLLEIFDITRIVVESYEIPFTPGEELQSYSISAYSDFVFELLIDTE